MDRKKALESIQKHGAKDGQYLLRSSANKPDTMVLSMAAGGTVFNFEINMKVYFLAPQALSCLIIFTT